MKKQKPPAVPSGTIEGCIAWMWSGNAAAALTKRWRSWKRRAPGKSSGNAEDRGRHSIAYRVGILAYFSASPSRSSSASMAWALMMEPAMVPIGTRLAVACLRMNW